MSVKPGQAQTSPHRLAQDLVRLAAPPDQDVEEDPDSDKDSGHGEAAPNREVQVSSPD